MKNYFIYFALIALLSNCGITGQEGVKISGKVKNKVSGEQAVLYALSDNGSMEPKDTLEVADNGSFEVYVQPSGPNYYSINFFNRQNAELILDGTEEEVKLELDGNRPNGQVQVEGARHTKYINDIKGLINDHKQDVQELNNEVLQAKMDGDQSRIADLTNNYYALVRESQDNIKKYIWNITPSLAALYSLQFLSPEEHLSFFDSIANRFQSELPDHFLTKNLVGRLSKAKNLSVGSEAPEISLSSPDGEVISLSSLRGNYVLIDFWAAWCKPCRAENPNVVRMYQKYSSKNFEILGVSLDKSREAWVQAIEQDGLIWKHVSDLKYFNSEAASDYQIDAIPATFLIGPDGKILAKGLRGASLEARLAEIFG